MGFAHFWLSGFDQIRAGFWAYFAVGLQNGALYAMIAVGYTLVYGVLGLINFAHGEVFMCGGFAGVLLTHAILGQGVANGWESVGLVLAGIVFAGLISALVATGVEQVAYRPLRRRHAPKLAYLISAIGASYFLQTIAGKEFGYGQTTFPAEVFPAGQTMFYIGNTPIHTIEVICVVVGTIMFLAADRIVRSTRLGRGIRAVAQDAETSALMGVNIDRTITLTFIIGGSLAGAAGFLYALQNGIVQNSGTALGIYAFTAAVLGGIGNLRGAALGGMLIGLFGSFSVPFAFEGNISWTEIYTFIILVLVLIVRPTGILGEKSGRTA
ncbi:MAG: amino acid/amide transporter rane protein 1, family [Acidimicrobiaceae bacterium]|nr:amino acid/amide transporter rane protein 1, family [Acidimicrobiaceae bacterium]